MDTLNDKRNLKKKNRKKERKEAGEVAYWLMCLYTILRL